MNVLIIGGTEFMGLTLVQRLQESKRQGKIQTLALINRGNIYWQNDINSSPLISHLRADRSNRKEFARVLKIGSDSLGQGKVWNLVVDFSCFEPGDLEAVVEGLRGRTQLYIYISTDSVYDVCDRDLRTKEGLITEDLSIRPKDKAISAKLNSEDPYAHDKLRCEEYLRSTTTFEDFAHVCLRLPDVIGPFDTSGRFWAYLLWIERGGDHPVHANKHFDTKKLSFVSSEDVADVVERMMGLSQDPSRLQAIHGQSVNVCCDEVPTLGEFLNEIGRCLGVSSVSVVSDRDLPGPASIFYPSVECGPLSNRKAKELLGYRPSDLRKSITKTVTFFVEEGKRSQLSEQLAKSQEKLRSALGLQRL